eukprot:7244247-Prorocentrum_lima.AAC.1
MRSWLNGLSFSQVPGAVASGIRAGGAWARSTFFLEAPRVYGETAIAVPTRGPERGHDRLAVRNRSANALGLFGPGHASTAAGHTPPDVGGLPFCGRAVTCDNEQGGVRLQGKARAGVIGQRTS